MKTKFSLVLVNEKDQVTQEVSHHNEPKRLIGSYVSEKMHRIGQALTFRVRLNETGKLQKVGEF